MANRIVKAFEFLNLILKYLPYLRRFCDALTVLIILPTWNCRFVSLYVLNVVKVTLTYPDIIILALTRAPHGQCWHDWHTKIPCIYINHGNPWSTELFNWHFQSLEVVDRGSETQLQVTENGCDLRNLGSSIIVYQCFKILLLTIDYTVANKHTECIL